MIDVKTFGQLSLESQNRVANAIDYMQEKFPGVSLPNTIRADASIGATKYGTYNPATKKITLNPNLVMAKGQDYATAIHEMAHYYDHILPGGSKETVSAALKSIGVRRNSRNADFAIADIIGYSSSMKYLHNDGEIIAKAIEKNAFGQGTQLSKAIEEELIRRAK